MESATGRLQFPPGQGRATQANVFAAIDARLPVERLMIGVLWNQSMGEQPRSREFIVTHPASRVSVRGIPLAPDPDHG
jgi:hypothetical protein